MKQGVNTLKAVDTKENYSGLVYNFGACPATLPREVMQLARAEFLNFALNMNVPFTLVDDTLNGKFISEAKVHGLVALQGHRSISGMRASMYNGMPEEGVDALITFMQEFERTNGSF